MRVLQVVAVFVGVAWGSANHVLADHHPPHNTSFNVECLSCHVPHGAAGNVLTRADSIPAVCMSCHVPGDQAGSLPFSELDQALPGVFGTSHRFDSGPSGHVEPDPSNTSTGTIRSGGAFTGRVKNDYTITIRDAGEAGSATFDWMDANGDGATAVVSGESVPLDAGLVLRFEEGAESPSFQAGDVFRLYVGTDIVLPQIGDPDAGRHRMAQRFAHISRNPDGSWDDTFAKAVCTVCHDPHSQARLPFDPLAPADPVQYDEPGSGRHLQRADNDANQMCLACHAPRDVRSAQEGSHPVGLPVPAAGDFRAPATLPLDPDGRVVCMTCHAVHYADSGGANGGAGDGYLLRDPHEPPASGEIAIGDLCLQCHTLAGDGTESSITGLSGSHFDTTTGALWPGGEYGSSMPGHPEAWRGFCVNCHWPHGWPDDADESSDYPRLWVERYDVGDGQGDPADAEDLCYTCHDTSGAATDIRADFLKGANGAEIFHHPVSDVEQTSGRSVECIDCHDPHRATAQNRHRGIEGTSLDGGTAVGVDQATQHLLCFNCHGDSYNASRPRTSNKRLDFATGISNSAFHPVTRAGRGRSANLDAQLFNSGSGLTSESTIRCTDCHNSDAASDSGPVTDSPQLTQGAHGSGFAPILRANFNADHTGRNWSDNNAQLCFLCHDQNTLLARRRSDGARTNFYNDDRDNLHWYHLVEKDATSSCLSCHYDIHSNRSAGNTLYRWIDDGILSQSTTPPTGIKTHLVNFAPDVDALNFSSPVWQIDVDTGQRRCDLACHGFEMDSTDKARYEPGAGDEPSHRYSD